jgi:flagellar biosynthesis protein FlhF
VAKPLFTAYYLSGLFRRFIAVCGFVWYNRLECKMEPFEQFTIIARSEDECRAKVRKKYGDGKVTILTFEPVSEPGVGGWLKQGRTEYRGYIVPHPDLTKYSQTVLAGRPETARVAPAAVEQRPAQVAAKDEKRPSLRDELLGKLLDEMAELKEAVRTGAAAPAVREHETIGYIKDALAVNGFFPAYIEKVAGRLKREFSVAALDDRAAAAQKVREWIGGDIQFYDEDRERTAKPRIFVLVGPTGVGKTTTMAKLAFAYTRPEKINTGKAGNARQVSRYKQKAVLFSIDRYRIGAVEEIKKYGELLEIPYQNIFDEEELQKEVNFYRENADIILIDTFGNNPHEAVKLAKMKALLDVCGDEAEYHLALSATTRDEDCADILRAFELFAYRSVVLTKLDETRKIGGILSCLIEKGKKVSFLATGQDVPYDIERGNAGPFLAKLTGLRGEAS